MHTPLRFAMVGSGNIAATYAGILRDLPEARLNAIVSRSGRRPEGVDAALPIRPTLTEIPVDVDAVILATPNGLHHEAAVEAARLGKHVFSEKVLDVHPEAMDTMIRACRQAGVKLGVAFQRRMSPDNQVIKGLLERKAFGRILAADLAVKFYRDQAYYDSAPYRGTRAIDGGGPFMQQAAHNIDIYRWFFGMPDRVASVLGTQAHTMESEDHGAAVLRYASGMIGSIIASTACKPGFPARLEIHAEKGSVVLENDTVTTWDMDGLPRPEQTGAKIHSGASSAAVSDTAGHEAMVRDFIDAIREDRDPRVTGEDARQTTDLVLQIYANAL